MSDVNPDEVREEGQADSRADLKAILVMFGAAVLMAVHFISGFSFDF